MITKLISFLLVFLMYASPYQIFGVDMQDLIAFSCIIIVIISKHKIYKKEDRAFLIFALYLFSVPLVNSYFLNLNGDFIKSLFPSALILFTMYVIFLIPNVNMKSVFKYYKFLVYLALVFFLIQEISYLINGYRITPYLHFLKLVYGTSISDFSVSRAHMLRSSSFFLEPAHLIQYIIPYFCIILSNNIKKKKISIELIFFLIIFFLVKSGSGFVVLAVLFILAICTIKIKIHYKLLLISLFSLILFSFFFLYSDNEFLKLILKRSDEMIINEDHMQKSSGFIRIYRGYFIYAELPFSSKLFGLANGSIANFIDNSRINYLFYGEYYLNGFQSLIINGGLFGLLLFCKYIYRFINSKSLEAKYIICSLIVLFFLEHMFLTPKMFLYILIASIYLNEKKENNGSFWNSTRSYKNGSSCIRAKKE